MFAYKKRQFSYWQFWPKPPTGPPNDPPCGPIGPPIGPTPPPIGPMEPDCGPIWDPNVGPKSQLFYYI